MVIAFTIEGTPVGKQRPRINTFTKRAYTPTKTKNYEELVKWSFKEQYKDFTPLRGAIEAEIIAIFEVPKSYSRKKREELIGTEHIYKPDVDNISKIILDSLNGLAYKDDSQIAKLKVSKKYGEKSEVLVILKNF